MAVLRVLLVQSWLIRGAETRDRLAVCERVDFEAALSAALVRGGHDLVILDASSSGLSRGLVEALMKDHGVRVPLVELVPGIPLVDAVRQGLALLVN